MEDTTENQSTDILLKTVSNLTEAWLRKQQKQKKNPKYNGTHEGSRECFEAKSFGNDNNWACSISKAKPQNLSTHIQNQVIQNRENYPFPT